MKIIAELDVKMSQLYEKYSLVKLKMPKICEKFPKFGGKKSSG